MNIEGFGRDASDLFKIAVRIAGFDAAELLREIHRTRPNVSRINVTMVGDAMKIVRDRHIAEEQP